MHTTSSVSVVSSSRRLAAGAGRARRRQWPPAVGLADLGRPGAADGRSSSRRSSSHASRRRRARARSPARAPASQATASGQASEKRRRLDELTSVLQRGDRLVVSELSRLGRSLGQIVTILDALAKAGVAFVALKENIHVDGERDIQTKVMTTLFALFAEVERDLISERASPHAFPAMSVRLYVERR